MPLVLDPKALSPAVLEELRRSLRDDLLETEQLVRSPAGKIRDPASIDAAADLLRSTLTQLDLPGAREPAELAAEVNLAYATLVAVIDLVKSHTDVPRVPRSRTKD